MDLLLRLEQSGLGTWVNGSTSTFLGYPGILLVHTIGMTLLAGTSTVIGLRIIGFAPQVPVGEMRKLVPLIWTGLVLSSVSGTLLLIAKATTMIVNPAFYVKMVAIALAVTTVFGIKNCGCRDPIPRNGRLLAVACIGLWLVAITAGRMMAYIGEAEHFGMLILK
jgi:hypothetical protein